VLREIAALTCAILALAIVAEACGTPAADPSADSQAVQATNVRRTAVAEGQRIIANIPSATPLPPPTATPAPTCTNAIWWTEARSHIGESRTVQGTVVSTRPTSGGAALLELGQPYPDPVGILVLVPSAATATALNGRTVCVPGRITLAEGRPTVQVRDTAAIVVVN